MTTGHHPEKQQQKQRRSS